MYFIEIVLADEKVITKRGIPSKEAAMAWIAANAGKPEYAGALFRASPEEPQYRGPPPPANVKPSDVRH